MLMKEDEDQHQHKKIKTKTIVKTTTMMVQTWWRSGLSIGRHNLLQHMQKIIRRMIMAMMIITAIH